MNDGGWFYTIFFGLFASFWLGVFEGDGFGFAQLAAFNVVSKKAIEFFTISFLYLLNHSYLCITSVKSVLAKTLYSQKAVKYERVAFAHSVTQHRQ